MPDEIELTPEEDAALDAACDDVGAAALRELGCSEERIREIQAMRPGGGARAGDPRPPRPDGAITPTHPPNDAIV